MTLYDRHKCLNKSIWTGKKMNRKKKSFVLIGLCVILCFSQLSSVAVGVIHRGTTYIWSSWRWQTYEASDYHTELWVTVWLDLDVKIHVKTQWRVDYLEVDGQRWYKNWEPYRHYIDEIKWRMDHSAYVGSYELSWIELWDSGSMDWNRGSYSNPLEGNWYTESLSEYISYSVSYTQLRFRGTGGYSIPWPLSVSGTLRPTGLKPITAVPHP
ncbi:MAG: hypothetical protein ACFFAM_20960 [Promethearchaeota archaeon]